MTISISFYVLGLFVDHVLASILKFLADRLQSPKLPSNQQHWIALVVELGTT